MQRFETKYDLLNAAYKDSQLKKGTVLLLQYLVHKSNKAQCFPAVETIAKALNVCKRTVQYNMRKLEKAGYIIRKDRWYNHQQLTNQYVFNFGIKEDKPGQIKFTDQEYDILNQVSFNTPDRNIRKITDIQKIYNMDLTSREKLLLIYLYHRANKKGIVYDSIQAFMEAIGVKSRTLQRILNSLRDKGLVKVKKTVLHGMVYFVMQLTGKVYHAEEMKQKEAGSSASVADTQGAVSMGEVSFGKSIQSNPLDQSEETGKVIHNRQNRILGHIRNLIERRAEKKGFWYLSQIFIPGIREGFDHIRKTIRKILRL